MLRIYIVLNYLLVRYLRLVVLFFGSGVIWFLGLNVFFIYSGAQRVLGSPDYQSSKFIQSFTGQPLPRMAVDNGIVWKGLIVVGIGAALAFCMVNAGLKGSWAKRGLKFGFAHWLLMTPWFEFYLPYNVDA